MPPPPSISHTMTAAAKVQEFVAKVIEARHEIGTGSRDFAALGKAYISVSTLDREMRTWFEALSPELLQPAPTSVDGPTILFSIQYVPTFDFCLTLY